MEPLALVGGAITGLALAMTGGGGTLLALPVLLHGVGLPLDEAMATSLLAVAGLAACGAGRRMVTREAQVRLGLWFALAGLVGAPVGAWLHRGIPPALIMAGFAGVVLVVAGRMWRGTADPSPHGLPRAAASPACHVAPDGHLDLTVPCGRQLAWTGAGVGVLSGLVGVGGGFLAVPALMRLSGMPIRPAVATSLVVVAVVAAGGAVSHALLGHAIAWGSLTWFLAGGLPGMLVGAWLAKRLPVTVLHRSFAVFLGLLALVLLTMELMP